MTTISIHALREEGDDRAQLPLYHPQISIHALREEGDIRAAWAFSGGKISIHALREEGDGRQHVHSDVLSISIPALREEGDSVGPSTSPSATYFYPRPPRGGRPLRVRVVVILRRISIHALREEGDSSLLPVITPLLISIHALREEGDTWPSSSLRSTTTFLSTPSARRATRRSYRPR